MWCVNWPRATSLPYVVYMGTVLLLYPIQCSMWAKELPYNQYKQIHDNTNVYMCLVDVKQTFIACVSMLYFDILFQCSSVERQNKQRVEHVKKTEAEHA